jgi:hypothetical protein
MFDEGSGVEAVLDAAAALRALDRTVDDATRVDRIRALEVLKAAASAAQAVDAADLDASQRAVQAEAGVPAAEQGRGVGAQVALARRDSPHRGGRHLGLAKALVHEMPGTLAALQAGRISEWRATILARETAVLTRTDREAVDAELAGDETAVARLETLGDRALAAAAKQAAYRLDAHSVVARARRAEAERRVTVRPAPDTMAYLTALLPMAQAVSAHVALARVADGPREKGDDRTRGQVMADTMVAALAGLHPKEPAAITWAEAAAGGAAAAGSASAGAGAGAGVGVRVAPKPGPLDVAVRLVMTDRALLDGGSDAGTEPAHLDGYGPVPAAWARELIAGSLDDGGRVFLTRLLTDPFGRLVGMESRARCAPPALAEFIRTRDGATCRTLFCDAPVRHIDHVTPHAHGGATRAAELQGLCEACNYTKQQPGWSATVTSTPPRPPDDSDIHNNAGLEPGSAREVVTTTPTGHTYVSRAPALPGTGRDDPATTPEPPDDPLEGYTISDSVIEAWLREELAGVT